MQEPTRLQYLYERFIRDEASPGEVREFSSLFGEAAEDDPVRESVFALYGERVPVEIEQKDWSRSRERILRRAEKAPVLSISRWWRAAASVVLAIAAGGYFFFFYHKPAGPDEISRISMQHDVQAPLSSRATITLASGQKIFLDSAGSGTLATQNNISIIKTADGKLEYKASSPGSPPLEGVGEANTLTNPRGSKVIDIMLSDGSHVWLNAGSSVTYPVAFAGNERKVSIRGEAYFEVKHDESHPFRVSAIPPLGGGGADVTVLGTHFNVKAYDDEDAIRVTLLEGSVRVSSPPGGGREGAIMLKPGDQGIVQHSAPGISPSALSIQHHADLEQVMAWKNGLFDFDNADIQDIMRQAARWYDVEVIYEGIPSSERYKGMIARSTSLAEMMKILALNGVKYRIEGKKIILTQ